MKITGLFDNKKYNTLALNNSKKYSTAKPFPNINFKNFLNKKIAEKLSLKFPKYNEESTWINYKNYGKNINTNFIKIHTY